MSVLPPINVERVANYITYRLRWYILEYAGKEAGIIGVSGGVDSAVTAYLTVKALGPERVYCYILPSKATPREDIEDAIEVIRRLGLPKDHWEIIYIDDIVDIFEKILGKMSKIERSNIKARVRIKNPTSKSI